MNETRKTGVLAPKAQAEKTPRRPEGNHAPKRRPVESKIDRRLEPGGLPAVLTAAEVAEYLAIAGRPNDAARRLRREGLVYIKIGAHLYCRRAVLAAWLEGRTATTA